MRMSKPQAILLARFVSELRPEWDYHGVYAALAKVSQRSAFDIAIMAIHCAADADAKTPAAITNPVYAPDYAPDTDAARKEHQRLAGWQRHDRQVIAEARAAAQAFDPQAHERGIAAVRALLQSSKGTPE